MQEYFAITSVNHTERSNVAYLKVMDAVADTKDTIITVLHNLQQKFIIGQGIENLVVEGDAKLFNILQSLKHEYGEELHWLIPFPGDWHALKKLPRGSAEALLRCRIKRMRLGRDGVWWEKGNTENEVGY